MPAQLNLGWLKLECISNVETLTRACLVCVAAAGVVATPLLVSDLPPRPVAQRTAKPARGIALAGALEAQHDSDRRPAAQPKSHA